MDQRVYIPTGEGNFLFIVSWNLSFLYWVQSGQSLKLTIYLYVVHVELYRNSQYIPMTGFNDFGGLSTVYGMCCVYVCMYVYVFMYVCICVCMYGMY